MPSIGIGIGIPLLRGAGGASLSAPQSFGVEVEASVLEPLVAAQSFTVDVAASVGSITELDPLTMAIADGLTVRGYYFVDASGVTEVAGAVSQLTDRHTSANHYVQATGANQPTYTASDATISNRGSVTGDGTNDRMTAAFNPPAPGNIFIWAVAKGISHTSADRLWSGDASNLRCNWGATNNTLIIANGSASAEVAATAGTWYSIEAEYHAASHRFRVGSTEITGAGVGTNNATSLSLFANAAGSNVGNFALSTFLICEGTPSAGFLSWLRGTWVPWLSASVVV